MNSKRSWSSMRRISSLERGMVLAGPLLQRGPVSIQKQRRAWIYFQVSLLPQLLLATTPRRAGFVCGQGLKNQLSWCCREDKISPCSPLEVLRYTNSIAETQDKRMIFHTPGTYPVQQAGAVKRSAINISASHAVRGHCFSGQGWDHSQGHLFTHSSISTNRSVSTACHMNILQTSAFMVTVL